MTADKKIKTAENEPKKIEKLFSKEQLISAERFQNRRDILKAVLEKYPDTEAFTIKFAEQEISDYMKGQVK